MITSGPLERVCWKHFAALSGDCKKSRIAPSNAIIVTIIKYLGNGLDMWEMS